MHKQTTVTMLNGVVLGEVSKRANEQLTNSEVDDARPWRRAVSQLLRASTKDKVKIFGRVR